MDWRSVDTMGVRYIVVMVKPTVKMKKGKLVLVFLFFLFSVHHLYSTDTLVYHINNFVVPSNGGLPICKGEVIELNTAFSCICGDTKFIKIYTLTAIVMVFYAKWLV